MDGEQIFDKTLDYLKSAEKSIQVEMFEFQNLTVDGGHWTLNGANNVPGTKEQQQILSTLIKKKQENPDIKIQVVLDAHKWYIDSFGKQRHYANADMIKYLKEKGIDVVPYPRSAQQGANLQHTKMLIVDGKKAILGGMNWGTHSAANHDACVAIETLPKYENSEVDNLVKYQFNPDWKFSWQRLGETKLVAGPLNEEEQKNYNGLDKEIKEENVQYYNLLKNLYDIPEAKDRYREGRLDLIDSNPMENPKIQIMGTKPKELELVGEHGLETTRKALLEKMKTCQKVRAEVFVLSDKELVETIIKRNEEAKELAKQAQKDGNREARPEDYFDAEFIVDPGIIEELSYTEKPFTKLSENGIKIRTYNVDKAINQRMHGKWAVFDDGDIIIGSTNWSGAGMNQNIKKGLREDHDLNTKAINTEIKGYLNDLKPHEKKLGIPSLHWTIEEDNPDILRAKNAKEYKALLTRRQELSRAINQLNKKGETTLKIGNHQYVLKDSENREIQSELQTIYGYYGILKARYNAQEKYKRSNNEVAIMFKSPSLAKQVFEKQFAIDWKQSEAPYDKSTEKTFEIGEFWNNNKEWA
jgi:phosphatidylserine/phosphatidylglycerophosphate/cardiolipin synthase-like enzyme